MAIRRLPNRGVRQGFGAVLLGMSITLLAVVSLPAEAGPCCPVTEIARMSTYLSPDLGLPPEYEPGLLLLRDDGDSTLYSALVELARRPGGRKMLTRLLDSGFVTVLVSERLRPMQAGLWGPIFCEGAVVGAALYVDLLQIRGLDHDPTGVETLAHEIRHQVDAARAFTNVGTYQAVYRAAASGDQTRSAQRYARRIRNQSSDMTRAEADRWLVPFVRRLPLGRGELYANNSGGDSPDTGITATAHQR